jgi:hypothetical protein
MAALKMIKRILYDIILPLALINLVGMLGYWYFTRTQLLSSPAITTPQVREFQ